ncbi:DUF2184 domain-containing protein [Candidatus Pacearchaeota archaeon]|nr:DUF2184 domain-containing protein [Candidatus Pacearchaeota archaeon]
MPKLLGNINNLDADQTIFFQRQLEFIKPRTFDVKYPSLLATSVFPVDSSAGIGAETITYEQFDSVGVMKFIADYADDLPRSDVKGKQFSIIVQSLGGSYGWSIQEVRAAAFANRNLNAMRAVAARRSNDQMVNRIGWFANGEKEWAGLTGILFHPNTTKSAAVNGAWIATATNDQIIEDVNTAINAVPDLTNGIEAIDTVLLPQLEHSYIATIPRSNVSDTTILEFLKRVHPGVSFAIINELKAVTPNPRNGGAATNVMLCYRRSPDHLNFEIPIIFEQFPAQERNLSFIVPTHSRNAGFNVYYPLSVNQIDGI